MKLSRSITREPVKRNLGNQKLQVVCPSALEPCVHCVPVPVASSDGPHVQPSPPCVKECSDIWFVFILSCRCPKMIRVEDSVNCCVIIRLGLITRLVCVLMYGSKYLWISRMKFIHWVWLSIHVGTSAMISMTCAHLMSFLHIRYTCTKLHNGLYGFNYCLPIGDQQVFWTLLIEIPMNSEDFRKLQHSLLLAFRAVSGWLCCRRGQGALIHGNAQATESWLFVHGVPPGVTGSFPIYNVFFWLICRYHHGQTHVVVVVGTLFPY